MEPDSSRGVPVYLEDHERVVVKEALRHYLDGRVDSYPYAGDDLESVLQEHLETAVDEGYIAVGAGMDDLYQDIFREYSRALQEELDEDTGTDSMASFFEGAFKGVVKGIRNAANQMP